MSIFPVANKLELVQSSLAPAFDCAAAGDPRTEQISGFRAYSLGLNIRGRTALQHWEGLWERVSSKARDLYGPATRRDVELELDTSWTCQGVLSDKFLLHIGGLLASVTHLFFG